MKQTKIILGFFVLVFFSLAFFSCKNEKSSSQKNVEKSIVKPDTERNGKKTIEKRKVNPQKNEKITSINADRMKSLKKSDKETGFNFGFMNDKKIKTGSKEIIQVSGEFLTFKRGWAFDKLNKKTAKGVLICVDNEKYFPAKYGFYRPDVGKHFKNTDFDYSGFEVKIPLAKLGKGIHTISPIIVDHKLKSYYTSKSKSFKINVK